MRINVYEAFAHQNLVGLGMTDARARECMGYGELRCTPEEIEEARNLLYPAQTEEGQLVSQEQLEEGQYRIAEDYAEPTYRTVGPEPEKLPLPYLYLPYDCRVGGAALPNPECSRNNVKRLAANLAIIENYRRANARNRCLYENQLNAGHPAALKNCDAPEYQPVPVPEAIGAMEQAMLAGGSITPPRMLPGDAISSGGGTVVRGGQAPRTEQTPVFEPEQEVVTGEQPTYAAIDYEAPPEYKQAPESVYRQFAGGFEEVSGGISEATGLSSKALLVVAAVVGGYLLLK